MTYTYAILDVPRAVYAAVRALLDKADYQHAFHKDGADEVIDMHGIALRSIHPKLRRRHGSVRRRNRERG